MAFKIKVNPELFFPLFADSLFGDLMPESLKSLSAIKQTKRFPKGATLFTTGDIPYFIYVLREGKAQLVFNDESGDVHLVHPIEPDEIFGLTESLANLPFDVNAETRTSCLFDCLAREDFIRFLQAEPKVCFRLLKLLSLNLQKNYELLRSPLI